MEVLVNYDTEDDNDKDNGKSNKVKKSSFKYSHLLSTEEQEVVTSLNAAKKTKIVDNSDSWKIMKFKF